MIAGMKTADAIAYFGTRYAIGKALGIEPASVYQWGEIVPPLRQLQLEILTRGALRTSDDIRPIPLPERA